MIKRILKDLFPGWRTADRTLNLNRPGHFRLFRSLFSKPPEPLRDLPTEKIQQINQSSRKYYEDPERRAFWMNKPFSDPQWAPWLLWRFGLLVSSFRLRPGDRVLDFGCGTGWTSVMLARMGAEVLGVDVAEEAVRIARENALRSLSHEDASRCRFEPFSGQKIPVEDEYFDFVLVVEAFHHLPNPRTILQEFYRVLNLHGYFGFAEPGLGHASTAHSEEEAATGILEADLDLETLYETGKACGFRDLQILVPALSPDMLTLPMHRARRFLRGFSWFLPADFIRSAILTSPIGFFQKGPYAITSLHPKSHEAVVRVKHHRISAKSGSPFTIELKISNPSDTVWLREGVKGRGSIRLGAHLLDSTQKILDWDFGRMDLPRDLNQMDSASLFFKLYAPHQAGLYIVRLDMVNEGRCWFSQNGSPATDIFLDVSIS